MKRQNQVKVSSGFFDPAELCVFIASLLLSFWFNINPINAKLLKNMIKDKGLTSSNTFYLLKKIQKIVKR